MWKRERMMVDVISLQHKSNHNNYNNDSSIATVTKQQQPSQPLLQNRLFYPFQGIHDDQNNFYAGNQYNQYGDLTINKNKRKSSLSATTSTSPSDLKRHKPLPPSQSTTTTTTTTTVKASTHYTFTSKPYDLMDNLMYYY